MNRRIKEAAKGVALRASKAGKSLFQGSSSSSSRREALLRCVDPDLSGAPIALQRDDHEDEDVDSEEGGMEGGEEHHEEDDESDEDTTDGDSADGSGVTQKQTRKSHVVAPPSVPTRAEARVLIRPVGDRYAYLLLFSLVDSIYDTYFCLLSYSSWDDTGFDGRGHHRQVNAILGNICRLYNPGIVVNKRGETIACTSWRHFGLAPDARFGNAQGAVRDAFWVKFKLFLDFTVSCL
jgi:hypothetical protein